MLLELNKDMLIDLVCGTSPNYSIFEHPIVKKCGDYNGSYGTWSWNSELKELSESELFDLYKLCVESFK